MVKMISRKWKLISKRALSVFLSVLIFVGLFSGVLAGVFVSLAGNPTAVSALNTSAVVQNINCLPVDPDATNSRTTLKASTQSSNANDYLYSDIIVNDDESVDFTITNDSWHNNSSQSSTSWVEGFTVIGQKINLAENPWLMVRWSGSGRCNGRIYFTITKDGTEYGFNGSVISNTNKNANDGVLVDNPYNFCADATTLVASFLRGDDRPFQVPLSNIINGNDAGYSYTNTTQTDFNAGVLHDYTIDLYKYLKNQTAYSSYFPSGDQWKDSTDTYITIYMSCAIVASESKTQLTTGTNVHWEQFAIGREVLDRPASLLPRSVEYMNTTDTAGTAVNYGRVSASTDGSVTFSNTSSTSDVVFGWNLRRYFNATELEAMMIEASYTGMAYEDFSLRAWFGGTTTTYLESGSYNYRGVQPWLHDLITYYNRSKTVTPGAVSGGTLEAVVDFNKYLLAKSGEMTGEAAYKDTDYDVFFPTDSLIFIGDIKLTLPAGAKITFTRLEFQVENEDIPATQANTVYPWTSDSSPDGLPPVGTPAYSTALNGASGTSYDWSTSPENAPIVKTKIDLLAMKTYSWYLWDEKTALSLSDDDSYGVDYTRKTDGSSIYSSSTIRYDANGNVLAAPTQNSYYTIMRFGPSDVWDRNYYTYLDVKDSSKTTRTPYLYYSYELVDKTPNDDVEAKAGFYFHFRNAARDRYVEYENGEATGNQPYCYQYYLDHSGIGLNECSSVWSLGYGASSSSDVSAYEYGTKALLSNAKERTGCIDISSLWVDGASNASGIANGEYLQLEQLRIYLSPGTEIKMNYFFVGGESLNQSVIDSGTLPREGGEAFPWAVSKEDFNKWTNPDSSEKVFTFANKVDVLQDIQDRAVVNGQTATFPGATVDSETGAVTVEVTNNAAGTDVNTGFLKTAGFGFDHQFQIQLAEDGDLSSMRYLNYSVDAPAGMRWSIMFSEHSSSSTDQRAIMTWCDSDARYNDDNIYTSPPAGKALFRMATSNGYFSEAEVEAGRHTEYDTYWKNKHNTSWRIYSIPGSQTGCIDLRQVDSEFEWDNIISIYLVAYQDPNLVLDSNEKAEVTFNYMYLTSTPVEVSTEIGRPSVTPGTIYNWGNTQVWAPSVTSKKELTYASTDSWSMIYKLSSANQDTSISLTPYLYYSYRFLRYDDVLKKYVTTDTDGSPLRVGIWISQSGYSAHYRRSSIGVDSSNCDNLNYPSVTGENYGYGKSAWVRLNDSDTAGTLLRSRSYDGFATETGCFNYLQYSDYNNDKTPEFIRFAINTKYIQSDGNGGYELKSGYLFKVDYLFFGNSSGTYAPSLKQTYTPLDLDSAPTPDEYQVPLPGTLPIEIDLNKTPYLFYCREYADGNRGTFSLSTEYKLKEDTLDENGQIVAQPSYTATFFRDASRTDGILISSGTPGNTQQYMLQSENGCIDVRAWYLQNAQQFSKSETGIITINAVDYHGAEGTTHYMYFGAEADKTIDLIPSEAAGVLNNGLDTRIWVNVGDIDSPANCELKPGTGEWDDYDTTTLNGSCPDTKIKFHGDVTSDGYNDMWINNDNWSQIYLRYGNIINQGTSDTFAYSTTGNNQMSGLMIDLNETPYLHFSFEQPDTSRTSIVLQAKNFTATKDLVGKPANEVRPWLSGYCPTSPAGQLINVVSDSTVISYYKDLVMDKTVFVSGSQSGVIDLRSWFTQTNGFSNVVSLDSIRFYSHTATDEYSTGTDLKINHMYLSSSASAAYSVTFHTNYQSSTETDMAYTQFVLKNANEQFVSDKAVSHFKTRTGYTFVGWYTDAACTEYFDINGTALTGNTTLYARWIKNSSIVSVANKEVNFLSAIEDASKIVTNSGTGQVSVDNESITIRNTGSTPYKITIPVNTAYNVNVLRSLFLGFDIDKTNGGYTVDANNNTLYNGFDITLNAQSVTPLNYSLVGNNFSADFLDANGILTAAPYDRECAYYTYLGVRDELPVVENTGKLVEVESISFTIPVGVSSEIRYVKAANAMSLQGNVDTCAPLPNGESFDLLSNSLEDPAFVLHKGDIVYDQLTSKSLTYEGTGFSQAAIHGISDGYAHIGGLYNYSINMTDGDKKYLYVSVDQPQDSYFTFAIYASFDGIVEGNTGAQTDLVYDIYTPKSVSVYSSTQNALVEKDYDTDSTSYIPADELYFNGDRIIKINLSDWYSTALNPYRSNNTIYSVKILGIRLFTDNRSTDATVNYMYIGGEEAVNSGAEFTCFLEYPMMAGHRNPDVNPTYAAEYQLHSYEYGTTMHRGDTVYTSLEDLANLGIDVPYDDPTKVFLGWTFSDITYSKADKTPANNLIYWNPNAQNGNMYSTSNPYGSWSLTPIEGFVTNQKSVFFTFTTDNGNTQVISPVFSDRSYVPTLSVITSGADASAISVAQGNVTALEGQTNCWQVPFSTYVVLRADGDGFVGWYDDDVLLSAARDYPVLVTEETALTAVFGSANTQTDTELVHMLGEGRSIVWLQSETGSAGSDFKLVSVSGGDVGYYTSNAVSFGHLTLSNIADISGASEIACYWNVSNSQLLKAIAPDNHHWEHLLSDGSLVRVSDTNEYTFVATTNIKLVAVADSAVPAYTGSIIIDEFVFDDNRKDALLHINGQVLCKENEEIVSCGMVFTDFKNHAELPFLNCAASSTVSAKAWNSTTGQFVVDFSIATSPEYVIRGYAIIHEKGTSRYTVRYSDTITTVF